MSKPTMWEENKTILMPQETWKKWDAALRSGKYKQGTRLLYNKLDNSYCCLGVLLKVCGASNQELSLYLPAESSLHKRGVRFRNGYIGDTGRDPRLTSESKASSLNDDEGWSFVEIADQIKKCVQTY